MSQSQTDFRTYPTDSEGGTGVPVVALRAAEANNLYFQCLLDNVPEGVVFIDQNCGICVWNVGAAQLTGLGATVIGRRLQPSLLKLRDLNRLPISDSNNPFENWVKEGKPFSEKYFISGLSGRDAQVEFQFFPVRGLGDSQKGGIVLLRDTSVQVELQRQLNDLYAIATLDPLTQVANRAEFERILEEYIQTHRAVGLTCSIIVADIDFFKKINDKHGHHVGDQALIIFANMLKKHIRPHDFVARYGGEEFVILCAHCNETAAAQRANNIREMLENSPQAILGEKAMTASFGVAELMGEDDSTSLFVRADHALLNAKSSGRNLVVKSSTLVEREKKKTLRKPVDSISPDEWRKLSYRPTLLAEFSTTTILPMFIERIKSMAVELSAQIIHASERSLTLQVNAFNEEKTKRGTMFIEIDVVDPRKVKFSRSFPPDTRLLTRIAIHPKKGFFSPRDHAGIAQCLMKKLRQFLQLDARCELKPPDFSDGDKERYGN